MNEEGMKHADFHIGLEFFTGSGKWRCTDVGTRVSVDKENGETILKPGIATDSITFHLFETEDNSKPKNQMRAGRVIMKKRRSALRNLAK